MTHRERVLAALAHRQPDRCPVDFWAVPEVVERLLKHFGALRRSVAEKGLCKGFGLAV